MPTLDGTIELIKLVLFMIFVASVATQVWIAFLDVSEFFTKKFEKFRPFPAQDKYSRITVVVMGTVLWVFR